jgi:hypothetical protein
LAFSTTQGFCKTVIAGACATLILAACGGGGGGNDAAQDSIAASSSGATENYAVDTAAADQAGDQDEVLLDTEPAPEEEEVTGNAYAGLAAVSNRFSCGGSVENEAWAMWNGSTFMRSWIQGDLDRVTKQGDVYGLYDFQIESQNLWSMAERCNRTDKLQEAARMIRSTYAKLVPAPNGAHGRAWVCKGGPGTVCYDSGLANEEVKLVSFQFLGVASFVANALAKSGAALTTEDKNFINETAKVTTEHLVRWANEYQTERLQTMVSAGVSDVAYDDSFLLFSDIDLWHLTVYAELAGVREWQAKQGIAVSSGNDALLRTHLGALLSAYKKRTANLKSGTGAQLPSTTMSDLDRGFWGNMSANTYASYAGATKPVNCSSGYAQVSTSSFSKRTDISWDFSHARRLVQAMDGLTRNREALQTRFGVTTAQLPSTGQPRAFAAALVNKVWNGSKTEPLFKNYWSGANGWFGAVYDSNSGYCDEGMKPYAMTDTFPTGGFITWNRYYPVIGQLGAKLYDLSKNSAGSSFMTSRYSRLSNASGSENRAISNFMFLPTLVGVGIAN